MIVADDFQQEDGEADCFQLGQERSCLLKSGEKGKPICVGRNSGDPYGASCDSIAVLRNKSKWKRNSVPAFYNCMQTEKPERPKSLEVATKRYWRQRSWSLGPTKDLRRALYEYNRDLKREVRLVNYSSTNAQNFLDASAREDISCFQSDQSEGKLKTGCSGKRIEDEDLNKNRKRSVAKAETFSDFDKKNKETLPIFESIQRKFSKGRQMIVFIDPAQKKPRHKCRGGLAGRAIARWAFPKSTPPLHKSLVNRPWLVIGHC